MRVKPSWKKVWENFIFNFQQWNHWKGCQFPHYMKFKVSQLNANRKHWSLYQWSGTRKQTSDPRIRARTQPHSVQCPSPLNRTQFCCIFVLFLFCFILFVCSFVCLFVFFFCFVLFCFVSFRFVSFRFVSFRFVLFCFVCFVLFCFVNCFVLFCFVLFFVLLCFVLFCFVFVFCIPGGTQFWVGYGCVARSFDHHPITKPERRKFATCLNHSFREGPFFKPIGTFLPCKLACMSLFDNLYVN